MVKAAPLTDTLKGRVRKEKIKCSETCKQIFQGIKLELMKSPVLCVPDFTQKFAAQMDANAIGAGIVSDQNIKGEEHSVVHLSKKFRQAEKKITVQ